MTFIGKTLVILYSAMALAALMWSVVVYTNRVDWAPPKGTPDASKGGGASKDAPSKILGKVNESHAEIAKLDAANERAIKRWTANYLSVNQAEQDRLNRRNFYRARLEIALTGKLNDAPVEGPFRELRIDENTGLLEPDLEVNELNGQIIVGELFKKQPVIEVRPAKALLGAFVYLPEIDKTNKTILDTQDKIAALIEQHKKLTTIINTEQLDGPFKGIPKGLRQLIKDQIEIEKGAIEEREYLNDYITNRRADAQLFIKRRDLLQARVEELMRLRPRNTDKLE